MTPLNTIIEEETRWENDFRKQFDELKLKPPKNSMPGAERELIIWYFRNRITTAMQRAYEAGRAQENTPDTEGEKEYNMPSIEVHGENWIRLSDHINLLSSRDTYWKERVLKELHKEMEEDIERAMKAGVPISVAGYAKVTALLKDTPINEDNLK